MDGTEVGVFEEAHKEGFGRLLERLDGRGLELEIRTEVMSDFANEARERTPATVSDTVTAQNSLC